jgi:hypothetical protein
MSVKTQGNSSSLRCALSKNMAFTETALHGSGFSSPWVGLRPMTPLSKNMAFTEQLLNEAFFPSPWAYSPPKKMRLPQANIEWVAQVSLLRPGFSLRWVLATFGMNPFAVQFYFRQRKSWAFGPPKEMKNCFHSATALHGSATLPFVIGSEAEGSAVQRTSRGNVFRQSEA